MGIAAFILSIVALGIALLALLFGWAAARKVFEMEKKE